MKLVLRRARIKYAMHSPAKYRFHQQMCFFLFWTVWECDHNNDNKAKNNGRWKQQYDRETSLKQANPEKKKENKKEL